MGTEPHRWRPLASLTAACRSQGEAAFLLATDVAARGLDVLGVQVVLNYDAPSTLASYLHRIGRTARAGASGRSVTFVTDADRALIKEVCAGCCCILPEHHPGIFVIFPLI
jgi:superfamily II DNA/RNA helicase